jgi:phage tail sheath gpL-like
MQWAAGANDIAGAAAAVAAINAHTNDLPVTAANSGTAVVTLTFKVAGTWGNDCLISRVAANGTTGTVTASGAALTGGTQEASIANVLTLVSTGEYDLILYCTGNTDAGTASATSGPGRLKTHISSLYSGRNAKLQQAVIGLTLTIANAKTGAAQHNFGPLQYVICQAGQSLPCELGGAEVGARLREESEDPAANRIGMLYTATLYGAIDLVADEMTDAEMEDCLQSGVTPVVYTSSGEMSPLRPVTTYFKDTGANPDDRLLDTSRISGIYAVAKDLRVAIPREFVGAKLSEDLEPGEEPLPEGVTEVRDVKGFVHTRVRFWIQRGVVVKAKYEEAYDNGQFLVRVNPTDASQCDIVLPIGIVPPLAKFSLVVNHVGPN